MATRSSTPNCDGRLPSSCDIFWPSLPDKSNALLASGTSKAAPINGWPVTPAPAMVATRVVVVDASGITLPTCSATLSDICVPVRPMPPTTLPPKLPTLPTPFAAALGILVNAERPGTATVKSVK